jgi:hypothetical protein
MIIPRIVSTGDSHYESPFALLSLSFGIESFDSQSLSQALVWNIPRTPTPVYFDPGISRSMELERRDWAHGTAWHGKTGRYTYKSLNIQRTVSAYLIAGGIAPETGLCGLDYGPDHYRVPAGGQQKIASASRWLPCVLDASSHGPRTDKQDLISTVSLQVSRRWRPSNDAGWLGWQIRLAAGSK